MTEYNLRVWSDPAEGQEDAYNDWYNNVHAKDICSLPEITGIQRFVFSNIMPMPRKYLAIYGVETDDPDGFFDRFAAGAAKFEVSPTIDAANAMISLVKKI